MKISRFHFTFANSSDPTKTTDAELIVDIGSILTWLKASRLIGIGVKPNREKDFRTIEGRIIRRSTGAVTIKYGYADADVEVVFANDADTEVLGVTALESLGYQVDPVSNELRHSD